MEVIRRLSSRVSEDENVFLGGLFGLLEEDSSKEAMDIQTFLKHNEVNEEAYYELRGKLDHTR